MIVQFYTISGFMLGFEIVWASEATTTTVVFDLGIIRMMIFKVIQEDD